MTTWDPSDPRDEAEGSGRVSEPSGSRYVVGHLQGGDDVWDSAPWHPSREADEGEHARRVHGRTRTHTRASIPGCALGRRTFTWTTGLGISTPSGVPVGPLLVLADAEVTLIVRVMAASIDYAGGADLIIGLRACYDPGLDVGRLIVGPELCKVSLGSIDAQPGGLLRAPARWPVPAMAEVFAQMLPNRLLSAQSAVVSVQCVGAVPHRAPEPTSLGGRRERPPL